MQRLNKIFFCSYVLLLALSMYGSVLCPDSYYYWNWSRHLQLSYYDGPPLIAYVMRIYTALFGQHAFTLYLIGLTSAITTAYLVYKIAFTLLGEKIANYALPLWLLTPGVIRYFFSQVTYNSLMIIFWALTLYFFILLEKTKKITYFYLSGLSIGLLLLSKYSGILLLIALCFICLFYKKYRFIVKNKHFYFSLILAFFIFSPVIIWNFQHHWISILFQLQHGYAMKMNQSLLQYIIYNVMDYNLPLCALVILSVAHYKKLFREPLVLLTIPTFFVLIFFSFSSHPEDNWSAPFYFTGAILLAYFISLLRRGNIIFIIILCVITLASTLLVVSDRFPYLRPFSTPGWGEAFSMRTLFQKTDPAIYKNKAIFGEKYQLLAMAHFFLKGQPEVYALNPEDGKQYYFWWREKSHLLANKKIILISPTPWTHEKNSVFPHCILLKTASLSQQRLFYPNYPWILYFYQCSAKS